MSNILKGLNEGRNYGRDSWDSNMPGYQGDYGGAENFGRRNREWDEDDRIDARLRAEYEKKKEYEQNGKFWLKLKDSQRHLPAGPFTGKQAANTAAIELLKQQPELKGNLLITAYGPDEQLDELSPATLASYKKKAGADATQADKRGDYARGNKRMSGIIKATKKEFDNDAKGVNEEELDENLNKWFKEKWVRFGPDGKIRGDCARGDDSEGKPKCLPQSKAHSLGKKGRASAASRKRREDPNPERSGKAINVNTKKKSNESVAEGLDQPREAGKAIQSLKNLAVMKSALTMQQLSQAGREAIVSNAINAAKTLEQSYLQNKQQGNAIFVRALRDEIDNFMRGAPINASFPETDTASELGDLLQGKLGKVNFQQGVAEEQLDELSCWSGYHRVAGTKAGFPGSCAKNKTNESEHSETCPHCGGEMVSEELMNEKKDACYYKVKSRYKVWPSAYASGALVKCRKSGADSWGNGGKKTEGVAEDQLDEKWSKKYKDSINCSNPKGFSQKAHCAGKQKNESAIMKGLKL